MGRAAGELVLVFGEVEEVLRSVGNDPAGGVLFYELQVKARASGGKWVLGKTIRMGDRLELDLLAVPVSFVSAGGDPNSARWFHLDVKPVWPSWCSERVRYEVVLIYRDNREKLVSVLRDVDNVLKGILKRIGEVLELDA